MKLWYAGMSFYLLALAFVSFAVQPGVLFAGETEQKASLDNSEALAEDSLDKTEKLLADLDEASQQLDETRIRLRRKGRVEP